MTDYTGLKAEIAKPAYSGMTDTQIAAALTTNTVTVYSPVSTGDWEGYLLTTGFLQPIINYTTSPPAGASATAILAARRINTLTSSPRVASVDLSNSTTLQQVQTMLNALVAEGTAGRLVSDSSGVAFAQTDMNAMLGMGTSTPTIAASYGFDTRHDMVQEISAARKWG